jgi:pescadillo protein
MLKFVRHDKDYAESSNDKSDNNDDEDGNVPIAAPFREDFDAMSDDYNGENNNALSEFAITDPEAKRVHQQFHYLTFFLSHGVARDYLKLIIPSYCGQVGWEGQDSPIALDDASITPDHPPRRRSLYPFASIFQTSQVPGVML